MKEIRVYFEGDPKLKPGFRSFFARGGVRVQVIATKARPEHVFQKGVETHPEAFNVLLRDSEGPMAGNQAGTHWMVQLMEAWFLADKNALESYYGQGFRRSALKQNPIVEEIPKAEVYESLISATRDTKKGHYHKTRHAPSILERIDPAMVRKAAPHCDRLFAALHAQ